MVFLGLLYPKPVPVRTTVDFGKAVAISLLTIMPTVMARWTESFWLSAAASGSLRAPRHRRLARPSTWTLMAILVLMGGFLPRLACARTVPAFRARAVPLVALYLVGESGLPGLLMASRKTGDFLEICRSAPFGGPSLRGASATKGNPLRHRRPKTSS